MIKAHDLHNISEPFSKAPGAGSIHSSLDLLFSSSPPSFARLVFISSYTCRLPDYPCTVILVGCSQFCTQRADQE